ncbi:MAG TPA: hypothetical protein VNA13_04600 [Xanthomonadales bacterium]|nr:hypothetical protein [Xanthomonadales bacterium]
MALTEHGAGRRRFLTGGLKLAAVAGVGTVAAEKFVPGVDLFPTVRNPFKFETKERSVEVVMTGLHDVAKLVPIEVTHNIVAQIEKDAPFLDSIFDKKATIICPTKLWVTCDLSAFAPLENETPTTTIPGVETTTTLPSVPMIGGRPAIDISDDGTWVLVRVPNPVIPPQEDVIPDLEQMIIINGQGGLGDKIQNLLGIHKISEKALIQKAQKDAWEDAMGKPEILVRAKENTREVIGVMLGRSFPNGVTIEFVDPAAKPEIPQVTEAPNLNHKVKQGDS